MKKYAIIVAGGKGLRMGMEVPKQFLPVGGKPVLMRTLCAGCAPRSGIAGQPAGLLARTVPFISF